MLRSAMHKTHYPAKTFDCGPLAKNPHEIYEYCAPKMGESEAALQLRRFGETLERPAMMGGPDVAGLLSWLVRANGYKKLLEIGTFRGTTALWLAESLPTDGKIITLDVDAEAVQTGMPYWAQAGVQDRIEFRLGDAIASMQALLNDEGQGGSFDLVFLDADKLNYPRYYELSLQLLKPNGVLAIDNVLWGGAVIQRAEDMEDIPRTIAALNEVIARDPRVDATLLPLSDGLTLVRKLAVAGTPLLPPCQSRTGF